MFCLLAINNKSADTNNHSVYTKFNIQLVILVKGCHLLSTS